jgi:hypothetical protein
MAIWDKGLWAASEPSEPSERFLPDCRAPGMLETLCLQSVEEDPVMTCVDEYLQCVQEIREVAHLHKARLHAFLASQKEPGLLLGESADKKYWPWDHPAFDQIRQFLDAL